MSRSIPLDVNASEAPRVQTLREYADEQLRNSANDPEYSPEVEKHDRLLLIRCLEMLGSPNANERDNAALQVERIRKKHGVEWKSALKPW
jgi:hypothetical protein